MKASTTTWSSTPQTVTPSKSFVRVSFNTLRAFLRLPADVQIVAIAVEGNNDTACLQLAGAVPEGEVTANYTYDHTTVVKFAIWERIQK